MKKDEVLKCLSSHKEKLKDLQVKSLALFGSVARGEEDSESDLDFLVDYYGKATYDQYIELRFLLEDILKEDIDLVTRKGLRPQIRPQIEEEAVYVT